MPPTQLYHPSAPPKSGRLGSLTKKEQTAVSSCRTGAKKRSIDLHVISGPGEQEDLCILRYLRASKFDATKALDAMASSMEWFNSIDILQLRGNLDIQDALNLKKEDIILPYCYKICGVDRSGRPVIIIHLQSLLCVSELFQPSSRQLLLKWLIWAIENALQELATIKIRTGYIVEDFTLLIDARSWIVVESLLGVLKQMIELAQSHYPERLGRLILIGYEGGLTQGTQIDSVLQVLGMDAPSMFDRISILPEFGWETMIGSKIDSSQLPRDYGGTLPPLNFHKKDAHTPKSSLQRSPISRAKNRIRSLSPMRRSKEGVNLEVTPLGGALTCTTLLLLMYTHPLAAPTAVCLVLVYFMKQLYYPEIEQKQSSLSAKNRRNRDLLALDLSDSVDGDENRQNGVCEIGNGLVLSNNSLFRVDEPSNCYSPDAKGWANTGDWEGSTVQLPTPSLPSIRPELQEFVSDRFDGDHVLKINFAKDENSWLSKQKGKSCPPVRALVTPPMTPRSFSAAITWQSDIGENLSNSTTHLEDKPVSLSTPSTPASVAMSKTGSKRHALKRLMRDARRHAPTLRGKNGDKKYGTANDDSAKQAAFPLLHVDVFEVPEGNESGRHDHIAGDWTGKAYSRLKYISLLQCEEPQFIFLLNLQVPGSNMSNRPVSLVLYWGIPLDLLRGVSGGIDSDEDSLVSVIHKELLQRFLDMPLHVHDPNYDTVGNGKTTDHSFRNSTLRIGTSVVPNSGPNKKNNEDSQFINVAKKHTVSYFRGAKYMEIDVGISSSSTSPILAGLCSATPLSIDLGIYLEGAGRLLGCARLNSCLVALAEPLIGHALAEERLPGVSPTGGLGGSGHRRFVPSSADGLVGVFTDSGAAPVYQLRGVRYVTDRRKELALPAIGRLLAVDLFRLNGSLGRADHVAQKGRCADRLVELSSALQQQTCIFIVNIQMPGSPAICLVAYWAIPLGPPPLNMIDPENARSKFSQLFSRFLDLPLDSEEFEGDFGGGRLPPYDFRNQRFKLIPSIVEGPWLVKRTVGNTATLIGQKVTCRYYKGATMSGGSNVPYMEVDIDIGSSQVAYKSASMAAEFAKGLTVDMGFCIQGEDESELPELLIGCLCISHLDMSQAVPLARNTPISVPSSLIIPQEIPPEYDIFSDPVNCVDSPIHSSNPSLEANRSSITSNPEMDCGMIMESDALRGTFSDIRQNQFKLRGLHYMEDQVKELAGEPIGRLLMCDLFKLPNEQNRVDNIASVGSCKRNIAKLHRSGEALFVLNYQVPGNPALSLVCVWGVPLISGDSKFDALFSRFCDLPDNSDDNSIEVGRVPNDDFRTLRFKLLPFIKEGPWIVRKMVGSGATLLAQKLTCRHFRGKTDSGMCYNELDIDIGSSTVANNTVFIAIGHAKNLVVDMGICIQGDSEAELPERLLGTVRLYHLDMNCYEPLCA